MLVGALGAAVGSITSYGLTLCYPVLSLAIMAPAAGAVGMLVGMIAFRGKAQLGLERRLRQNSLLIKAWNEQRKQLPADLSKDARRQFDQLFIEAIQPIAARKIIDATPTLPDAATPPALTPPATPSDSSN